MGFLFGAEEGDVFLRGSRCFGERIGGSTRPYSIGGSRDLIRPQVDVRAQPSIHDEGLRAYLRRRTVRGVAMVSRLVAQPGMSYEFAAVAQFGMRVRYSTTLSTWPRSHR